MGDLATEAGAAVARASALIPPKLLTIRSALNVIQVRLSAAVGAERQISALKKGSKDAAGFDGEDGWSKQIEGACGECACALGLGMFWQASVDTYRKGGDVGPYQVRTRSKGYYELYIRDNDNLDAKYVLVIGKAPVFELIGWFHGRDVIGHKEWRQTYGGRPEAWFVPRNLMRDLRDLKEG